MTELREARTQRLDGLTAVITELEAKTSPDDADTQAQIRDYRLYASAVQGVEFDLTDAEASWLAVQGWLTVTERRVDLEFGIGYDDDMDRAQAGLDDGDAERSGQVV